MAAENAAFLSKMRYNKGVTSYLEVLDTERTLFDVGLERSELKQRFYLQAGRVWLAWLISGLRELVFSVNLLVLSKAFLICLIAMPVVAQQIYIPEKQQADFDKKNVLFLNSYHPGYEWSDEVFRGIHSVLDIEKLNILTEYLDSKRFNGKDYQDFVEKLIRYKYSDLKIDAIIASDHFAVGLALAMRGTFQRGVPMVYLGIDKFAWEHRPEYEPICGIEEKDVAIRGTIDMIFSVQPKVKTIYVVADGDTVTTPVMVRHTRKAERSGKGQATFKYLLGMSMREVEEAVQAALPNSAVLWLHYLRDKNGRLLTVTDSQRWLAKQSSAPVYCTFGFKPGNGILGGHIYSGFKQGRAAAELVTRILNEEKIPNFYRMMSPCINVVDYPVMRRFGLKLNGFPADSIVYNKPNSKFHVSRLQIIGVSTLIAVLSLLIAGLLLSLKRRKKMEQALSQSEQLARILLNSTSAVTHLLDADGTIIDLNDAMAHELGGTREELIGTNVFDRFPCELAEYRQEILRRAANEQKVMRFEDGNVDRDNKVYDTFIYPIEILPGKKQQFVIFAYNITDYKRAELALKESEARLREAQRIANIGNWKLDFQTNVLTWSDEVFRIFEIDKEHFVASYEAFLAAVHPDDRDAVNKAYKRSLEIRKPYNITHRLLMPGGRIKYVQERCETYFNPEGKPLRSVGTVQDITERIYVQNERRELRHELAHLNRIMSLNELATSLAHEINQPLGAIMNNVAAAKTICSRSEEEIEDVVEILEDVINDANRAGQIVAKIRGLVKKEDPRREFEILNMNVKVDEAINLLRNTFNINQVNVHLDKQQDLLPVRGDRVRLEQVIVNLVTNAIEAMKESLEKILTIRTAMHSSEMIIVSVKNSGPGIDAEIRRKLFEPFFSTKKSGLGMGLRICQSIVEEHGGRIWLENPTEDGTTFSFTLKVHQEDAA
jgi:PAS domain S-box-containing protein